MWKKRGKKLAQKRKKIGIAAAAVIVAAAGSTLIYHNLPQTKVEKQLTLAAKYMTEMNYLEAQEAYTEALSIDEGSVRAYRGLADDYAAQGQLDEAAEILHQGYETTQSEILLQNYCATVLNSVVEHVNEKTAGLDDIRSCLTVLESDPDNESVRSVLENCVQQVTVQEDTASLMLDELDGTSDFDEYADVAEKLLGLAEKDNSYQEAAYRFIIPKAQKIYLSLSHRDSWKELVERAQALGDAEADGILACLSKQQEISDYFAPMFEAFEQEGYEAARNFIVTDQYKAIRDAFINRTMEYWTGNTYVPVTKEAIVFLLTDDGWKFSFVEDDSLAQPSGTIRVLGQKMFQCLRLFHAPLALPFFWCADPAKLQTVLIPASLSLFQCHVGKHIHTGFINSNPSASRFRRNTKSVCLFASGLFHLKRLSAGIVNPTQESISCHLVFIPAYEHGIVVGQTLI